MRAYIGEMHPNAAKNTRHPVIEFTPIGAEVPNVRLFQGRPGAYWITDGLQVKIHKIHLPGGRVAVPEGNGYLKVTNADGTTTRMSVSELPE